MSSFTCIVKYSLRRNSRLFKVTFTDRVPCPIPLLTIAINGQFHPVSCTFAINPNVMTAEHSRVRSCDIPKFNCAVFQYSTVYFYTLLVIRSIEWHIKLNTLYYKVHTICLETLPYHLIRHYSRVIPTCKCNISPWFSKHRKNWWDWRQVKIPYWKKKDVICNNLYILQL